jgi:hypothetical protein
MIDGGGSKLAALDFGGSPAAHRFRYESESNDQGFRDVSFGASKLSTTRSRRCLSSKKASVRPTAGNLSIAPLRAKWRTMRALLTRRPLPTYNSPRAASLHLIECMYRYR